MKISVFLLMSMFLTTNLFAANQWRSGSGEQTILGSSNASDIDSNVYNKIVTPLDNLLANYRQGINLVYNSVSQLTASAGSITVSNSAGTIRLMLLNTSDTTITWSDLDAGSEASATTYYVYAIAASDSSTTATFKISANSTSPSGVTYYKRIGSFTNDSSSNIYAASIVNDNQFFGPMLGSWESKSVGTTYQASTDGFVVGWVDGEDNYYWTGYTDTASTPTTVRITAGFNSTTTAAFIPFMFPVRKGDYYRVVQGGSGDSGSATMYFIPIGS